MPSIQTSCQGIAPIGSEAAGAHPRPVAVAAVTGSGEVAVQVLLVLRLAAAAAAPPAAGALAGLVAAPAQDLIPVVIVPASTLAYSAGLSRTSLHKWRRLLP